MDHNDVFRKIRADDALPENGIQPIGHGRGRVLLRNAVAIGSKARQLLDNAQLLDIPGNGRLGAAEALIRQRLQQLLLGLYIGIGNDLNDLCLSLCFHMHASYFP